MKVPLPPLPETPGSFKPLPPPSMRLRRRRCQRHKQTRVRSSKVGVKAGT